MEVQAQSRKLLPNTLLYNLPPSPTYPASGPTQSDTVRYQVKTSSFNSLNESIVLVLSILLCSLICVLVISAIVRCVLRIMSPTCYHREPPGPLGRPTKTARAARKDALRALPALVYTAGLGLAGAGSSECAICLSEFVHGEHVRVLPACNHGFHVRCIDRWLAARPTCPTCRNCLFGTCVPVAVATWEDIDL
ncbi:RING-H2 finger protein ATL73-like [Ananas comosus]|uniref:RING-H2 finger protein ATL73-like n=1 Tax=Ananas comosus TaxID=4615 RepID=A0A199W3X4_ANACO|nr:RING-H2 finger protein ATL73-like [Ananas comosus]OAY83888.1 RING-H2 finger protein ATL78 [Ananas comosus]